MNRQAERLIQRADHDPREQPDEDEGEGKRHNSPGHAEGIAVPLTGS